MFETDDNVIAVVQKVVSEGKHGAFAVATTDAFEGSITFSLEPTVWQEQGYPEPGEIVCLSSIRKKRAGWRAKKGRYYKPSDEQTATRKEQEMLKRIETFIKGMRSKWFPTEEDKDWKQWVDYKPRERKDLVDLLTCDVRDSFKRRAIFLLLVPSAEFNHIYWKGAVGKFYRRLDFLMALSPELLNYATELIVEFYSTLKQYVQEGDGNNSFRSILDKYEEALCFYNNCLVLLLILLPEEQCERIFSLFSIRDISIYASMDDSSGYHPFMDLLYSKVDEKWKRRADALMRQIINDELAGRSKPREKWEDALKNYTFIISMYLNGEGRPYSEDSFAEQLQFLVSEGHYGRNLIDDWKVPQIFQIFSADTHRELRHQVAKFVVFGNKDGFNIYLEETLQGAEMMLSEFGQEDSELAERIQVAIKEYRKRSVECQSQLELALQAEEAIMKQMR